MATVTRESTFNCGTIDSVIRASDLEVYKDASDLSPLKNMLNYFNTLGAALETPKTTNATAETGEAYITAITTQAGLVGRALTTENVIKASQGKE